MKGFYNLNHKFVSNIKNGNFTIEEIFKFYLVNWENLSSMAIITKKMFQYAIISLL